MWQHGGGGWGRSNAVTSDSIKAKSVNLLGANFKHEMVTGIQEYLLFIC